MELYIDAYQDFAQSELNIDKLPKGEISYGNLNLFSDADHRLTNIPVMVSRGAEEGPTLGLLAVVHGNELNGIRSIHHLFKELNPQDQVGNIVALPVVNLYGYLHRQRQFLDSQDLNRIMPGREYGTPAEIYGYRLMSRVISTFDYMIDIHTASFGRSNCHYVRADLSDPNIKRMAQLQDANIIVHTKQPKGSFRSAAVDAKIPSVTIELGDSQMFQRKMVNSGIEGIRNVMIDLGIIEGKITKTNQTTICKHSYWLRVDVGGVLSVFPDLLDFINEGEEIAELTDIYGRQVKSFFAPEKGIVVGKSTNPVCFTGGRILHLGVIADTPEALQYVDDYNDIADVEDDI